MIFIEVRVNKRLGNKLRKLRVDNKMTQQQLADTFGLSVSAVSMYEMGKRVPSDAIKRKYSMFFDKDIENIFFN